MKVGPITVWRGKDEKAVFYNAGLAIDADGAPNAYGPAGTQPLDYLGNAGVEGNWWGLVSDESGHPVLQCEGDPCPGYHVSPTSLCDSRYGERNPLRYVDSTRIPYIALPTTLCKPAGILLGNLAYVINGRTGAGCGAIFADVGPRDKLGEGSIALAQALGIDANPKRGGTDADVLCVVFPDGVNRCPRPREEIEELALALFNQWGGRERLLVCFPEYPAILARGQTK